MPHINLLPWREELRKRKQKEFGVLMVVALLAMGGIVLGVHTFVAGLIDYQNARNDFLSNHITQLDRKIKAIRNLDEEKKRLLARMEIIQELQASRPEVVHLFDELVDTQPDGVYFKSIAQKGRSLTVQGVAQSNARVSSLMRNMDGSDWLSDPALVEIKAEARQVAGDTLRLSGFSLIINQADQNAPAGDDQQ